jgi:PAS domain S-box-containing protein
MGATDYIVKDAGCGFLELFPAVIEQAIFTTRLAEQKMRAVEKLRTSEKKYRMLFELASDAFLVAFPPDDTIIDSNKAATTMLGYSKEEFRTLTIWEVFAPEVIEKARIEWKTQLKDSNYFSLESIWLRKDGSQLPVAMSGVLFEFEGIPQIQFIAHYITERKQEEEKKDNHSRGCHRHPL